MIDYRTRHTATAKDGFSQVLREAQEVFAADRIQMLGTGIAEILTEDVLFGTYKEELSKGLSADDVIVVEQLMDNTRVHVMTEASLSGIQPISALTLPMLRKVWPRIGVSSAIPTEPVKLPKFSISYMLPYILDMATGEKLQLPQALRGAGASKIAQRKLVDVDPIVFTGNAATTNLLTGVGIDPKATYDSVDSDFSITQVVLDVAGVDTTVEVRFKLSTQHDTIYGEVASGAVNDVLFGKLNRATGELTLSCVTGKIKSVTPLGYVSAETNNRTETVSFDIKTKDVDIPTGAHISAPLPIEWLQDTMAMYQIDGAMKVIDIMSDVLAQKVDIEGRDFLDAAQLENIQDACEYVSHFDVKPRPGYTGSPKEWRDEIRTVIDHVAIKVKNDSSFTNGKFAILGNDIDTQLLPNVNWIFSSNAEERGGVEVNYNIGAYSGSNRYTVISTPNVPQGSLYMIYIPSNPDQMTFKYYPYAFNVERNTGYIDPARPNVPSVMMTRRHKFDKFTPLIAKINILNNDGTTPLS